MLRQPKEQLLLDLIEVEAPTLDNFVVGCNAELLDSLRACRSGIGPQSIYLWGATGCGKTHLLRSMTPFQRWRVPEFDDEIKIYTVDNVEQLGEEDLEKLFHLLNNVRAHPESKIVLAGHFAVQHLTIREDIRTRLSWGLVYHLQYLPESLACKEFVRLAQLRGIDITNEQSQWVIEHCPRDMRGLGKFLDKIDRLSMQQQRKVTMSLLQKCIEQDV